MSDCKEKRVVTGKYCAQKWPYNAGLPTIRPDAGIGSSRLARELRSKPSSHLSFFTPDPRAPLVAFCGPKLKVASKEQHSLLLRP